MFLKTRFFLISTSIYFVALLILFLASLETFALEASIEKRMIINYELISFLLLTLFFAASNALFIVFYRKLKQQFDHHASIDAYEDQLQTYSQKFTSLLNTLQEGVLILDEDLKLVMWNKIAEMMLKVKFKSSDETLFDFVSSSNEKVIELCHTLTRKALESGCVLKDSVRLGQSKKIHLDLIASPIVNEPRVVLILQDNSSDYRILEMGKDFVANASHELRTPVTIVKGFAETIRDLPVLSETMLEDITEKIIRSCQRMNATVKNLLVLADLDNTEILAESRCDLVALIEGCSYELLTMRPEVCIETLQNQDEVWVEGEKSLLQQAVMNLFENAVKYSKGPAHIIVTIKQDGYRVTLQIEDHGMGIEEEHLNQIFDRFYRVNKDRSRKLGGTGLGLSIVHSIVEKHHGEIEVFSEKEKGTRFVLTFLSPVQSEEQPLEEQTLFS